MKKPLLAPLLGIAAASLVFGCGPTSAQSAQDQLDERYNRALAAGYKALFLCGAIANAERFGSKRSEESVMRWELTGIQAPLDAIVPTLDYQMVRHSGRLIRVEVDWAEDMPPRIAISRNARDRRGCSILPIGTSAETADSMITARERSRTGFVFDPPIHSEYINYEAPTSALAELAEEGFAGRYGEGSRTTALIVIKDDEAKLEQYAEGFDPSTPQRTWSVAKSITATLVGAAVHDGLLDVSQSSGLGKSENDPRRAITVDQALRMATGRYSDTPGNRTDPLYFGGATVAESATNWPLVHAPGYVYRYANNDTLVAALNLPERGERGLPYPFAVLSELRMARTMPETDWQGGFVLSSQVWATARDLARLGQLHLNDGALPSGERILPEGWVEYISTPSGPQPDGPFGYGAGWWLMNKSEGIPPDTFAAFGNRGQYVVVVPSRSVVIVRRGEDPAGNRFDIAAFTRDVLAALPE